MLEGGMMTYAKPPAKVSRGACAQGYDLLRLILSAGNHQSGAIAPNVSIRGRVGLVLALWHARIGGILGDRP